MRIPAPNAMAHSRRPIHGAGGVVLLEALIALAIFAIAVIGLAKSLNSAVKNAQEARLVSQVTRSMENALEEALHRPVIEPGEWTGDPDPDGLVVTTIIREAEIENGDGQLLSGLFEIEVTGVLPRGHRDEQSWQLRTLCYPPLYATSR